MLPPSDPHQLGLFVDQIRRNGWMTIPLAHASKQPARCVRRWKGRRFNGTIFEAMAVQEGPLGIGLRLDNLVVIAPNHRLVEAIPASAASSNPGSDRVREVFAPPWRPTTMLGPNWLMKLRKSSRS